MYRQGSHLLPVYEVRGKVMFSVCPLGGGGVGGAEGCPMASGLRSFAGEWVPQSLVPGPVLGGGLALVLSLVLAEGGGQVL